MKQDARGQIIPSPYIVTVYNYWIEYDNPQYDRYCVLMELCEKSLETEIANRYTNKEPFSEKEIWQITCNILEGIMVCHNLNYTHRDLKPANSTHEILFPSNSSFMVFQNKDMETKRFRDRSETFCIDVNNVSIPFPLAIHPTKTGVNSHSTTKRKHLTYQTRVTRLRISRTRLRIHSM